MPLNYGEVGTKKKKASAPVPEKQTELVPMDLELVKPGFLQFETEVTKWEAQATSLVVNDEVTRNMAVTLGGEASRLKKTIDEKRNQLWAPYLGFRKRLDNFVGNFTERLDSLIRAMKQKERTYLNLQEMQRLEAEKKARDEIAKIQENVNKEAAAKGIPPVKIEQPVIPAGPAKVRTETGITSYEKKTWKGEVIAGQEDKVTRYLCSPDKTKIKDAVGGGLREGMPGSEGLHIWEDAGQRYIT